VIAIDHIAVFVPHDDAVGVAVKRNTNIGTMLLDGVADNFGCREPQFLLILVPSGLTP
jgi:hypothetical protein